MLMKTCTLNRTTSNLAWVSALPLGETIEIFQHAFSALALEDWSTRHEPTRWIARGALAEHVVVVSASRGVIRRAQGIEALMLLAKAMDLFPEVIAAGFEDGAPLYPAHLTPQELRASYPDEDGERVHRLAAKAGLVSVVRLTMRSHLPTIFVGKRVDKTGNFGCAGQS